MFCDQNRKTITKTRVIAGGRATVSQQVVRIDYCEPHTCDLNHELGKQNSQRI